MHGFYVFCFVQMVSHCLGFKPSIAFTIELLLCSSVFVILHNPQNIPFPPIYDKYQITVSSNSVALCGVLVDVLQGD